MYRPLEPLVSQRGPGYREAAYLAIKEAILSSAFEYDQPLIEENIATQLHVSRTPVREALAILQHEGLIAARSGRGYHVRRLTQNEFVAMFVANEAVEPYLVRQAALIAASEQLQAMQDAITHGKQCAECGDLAGLLRSGRDFHRAIGLAANNIPLTQFVVQNEERTDLYLLSYQQWLETSDLSPSNQEHERIFQAIAHHNPEDAARLVVYHSQSVRERLSPFFDEDTFRKISESGKIDK